MALNLGSVDAGSVPANKTQYFDRFHHGLTDVLRKKLAFRDETNSVWRGFTPQAGTAVRDLQQFLFDAGFMARPEAVDGIFGYTTASAVRLFQEYVRTILGDSTIGAPDGVVGPGTMRFIENWKNSGRGRSDWGNSSASNPSAEFSQWLGLLQTAKDFFQQNPSPIRQKVEAATVTGDTRKIADWDTSPSTIHLIGLRTGQEVSGKILDNDDLFILLINGMCFKFWGSTDPNPEVAERPDIPFIIEGQHEFRFSWHKVDNEVKAYRALQPATDGVLCFRDKNRDRALTDSDINNGFDPSPNKTIHIHWSGAGKTNFSAGCQVIAGRSYINDKGNLIDCSRFAAASYPQLGGSMTRGAYNVMTDLMLAYAPSGVQTIALTVGRDETLRISNNLEQSFVKETVEKMKGRG